MATRAEQQRYLDERRKPKRKPRPGPREKRRPTQDIGARNLSLHGAKNATVVTEETFARRPTRKSTRKGLMRSATRIGQAKTLRDVSPETRHTRRT